MTQSEQEAQQSPLQWLAIGIAIGWLLFGKHDGVAPGPNPEPSIASVLLIEETDPSSPNFARAALINAADQWQDALRNRDIDYREYDIDATELGGEVRIRANSVGLPALVLLDASGSVVNAETCGDWSTENADKWIAEVNK